MEDDLAEIVQRFALSLSEMQGAVLDAKDADCGILECQNSLIGRIKGEKVANFTGVKKFVTAAWGYPKELRITELGPNLFQFLISRVEEREKILNGGPWIMDNQILVLRPWRAGIEEDEEAFNLAPLWVQVWNLPIHWIAKEVGRKIGSIFAEVKEVIIPQGGGKEGKHLKLWVTVDLSQPLPRGTAVKLEGGYKWLQFKYERSPDFCYHCGLIGHSERSCKTQIILSRGQSENQYGPWMRAGGGKLSPQKESTYSHSKGNDKQHWLYRNGELIPKFQSPPEPQKELIGKYLAASNREHREEGDRNKEPSTSRVLPEWNSGKEDEEKQMMGKGQSSWEQEEDEGMLTDSVDNQVEQLLNIPLTQKPGNVVMQEITNEGSNTDLLLGNKNKDTEHMQVDSGTKETGEAQKSKGTGRNKRGIKVHYRKRQPLRDITEQQNEPQELGKRKFQLRDEEMEEYSDQEQTGKKIRCANANDQSGSPGEGMGISLNWSSSVP